MRALGIVCLAMGTALGVPVVKLAPRPAKLLSLRPRTASAQAPRRAIATPPARPPRVAQTYGIKVHELAHTLEALTGAAHLGDIGRNGPPMASAGNKSLFHALFGRDSIRMSMDLLP